jgi:hypothetical protein
MRKRFVIRRSDNMASRFHDYRADNARAFINIDDLLRVFSSAEKAEGLPETFTQKVPDDITKPKCDMCKSNNEQKESKKMTPFALGNFDMVLDGTDVGDDDDDGIYVCHMCDKLGYSGKYVPELCDTCKACASCAEYEQEECSGCSYSVYRDGEYYHEKLPESELISEHDAELFRELEETHSCRMKRCDGVGKFRNR